MIVAESEAQPQTAEQKAAEAAAIRHEAQAKRNAQSAAARPPIRDTTHPDFDAEKARAWNEAHPAPAPQIREQNEKSAPCPCANSPVTLEQIDQRVAALSRLVLVAIIAAGVAYILAGRKEESE